MNITRRDDEPGKLNLSFSVGVTHIVDEVELLEALAGAGVLEVDEQKKEMRGWFGLATRYVSPWKEAK